jgi:dihydroorotate dehydrogenase (subfamily 1) family protein
MPHSASSPAEKSTRKYPLGVVLQGNGRELFLKNPVLTASGTFGYGLEFAPFGELSALGGIIVKGLSLLPREGNAMPRIAETPCGMLNAIGLQNCGVQSFLKDKLPRLQKYDLPVIANLYGTSTGEFAELARILSAEQGIAALEVNISCPNVKEGGVAFGQNPKMAREVTKAVMEASGSMPVIVKLSPNVTDIVPVAKACEEGGATCLSLINTLRGMAVDIARRKPFLSTVIGGLSGPAIKPVALRCVWEVANAVSIPVIGVGGILTAEDVLEFILVGAHAVQIGTGNLLKPDTAFTVAAELPRAMARHGIDSLAEYRHSLEV